jgi:selenocysteine lyase/cysteine desulfurase
MAPHFYNTEAEIDHAMATLREIVGSSAFRRKDQRVT